MLKSERPVQEIEGEYGREGVGEIRVENLFQRGNKTGRCSNIHTTNFKLSVTVGYVEFLVPLTISYLQFFLT